MPKIHVTANSKEVKPGSIFFALKGAKYDGHDYIDEAKKNGASQIFCERDLGDQARKKLGEMASEMYDHPTRKLTMIGVTGTSGKTTTSYLIQHLLTANHKRCARLGTNGAFFEGKEWPTINTTPDALSLQKWFREVLDLGATHVVMEVSSHALHQDRVWGIAWDAAAFLNLSSEHMDYHKNLDDYFAAKELLFTEHAAYSMKLGKKVSLWTNGDHAYGSRLLHHPTVRKYSIQTQIRNLHDTATGLAGEVLTEHGALEFDCPLFGAFQIENILAALSVVESIGIDPEAACDALASFTGVPGRMEFIENKRGIFVFVDYAHKPEALEKVLEAIQGKRIITVFGCGGDRDKTKRPMMGRIAALFSDYVIVTSDNPRTEDPKQILKEVEAGVLSAQTKPPYEVIEDRALAIKRGIALAHSGDIVLIAGKGHEDYQIIGAQKRYFDDREEARKALGST